ncbi:hypothetical protein [Salsipaludibacter albus]|uniref:hypothetical protein n=1 Tax=Salsipaludibacter albus TaxID=2849650 RepID=UPI001EE3F30A|nr:hypothetical protein [Salsipaludibacter albus]MBY5163468.1 hypothetical protein [Salsipaludibacter albus]
MRPKLVADGDGLRLELTVSNVGPVRFSGTLTARVRGRTIRLGEPDLSVAAGSDDVSVSYDVLDPKGLRPGQRVSVRVVDAHGVAVAASSSGITLGTGVAAVALVGVTGLGIGGVVDALGNPGGAAGGATEAATSPATDDLTEEPVLPAMVEALLPTEVTLDPVDDTSGQAPVVLTTGTVVSAGISEGVEYMAMAGTLSIDGVDHAMDVVHLPRSMPADGIADLLGDGPMGDSVAIDDVDLPADQRVDLACFDTNDQSLIGHYWPAGSGKLTFGVELIDQGGSLAWSLGATWTGPVSLAYLDGVDARAYEQSDDRCDPSDTASAYWITTVPAT